MIKVLQFAIKGFETEYGRCPLSVADSQGDDLTVDSANSRFMGSLVGEDLQDNPRGIKFIELPLAKHGKGGLVGEKGSFRLLDQWGHPYRITLDANRDEQVRNPDRIDPDPTIQAQASEWLPVAASIYSCGMDGTPHTADDITSWRGGPPPSFTTINLLDAITWPSAMVLIGFILTIIGAVGIYTSRRPKAEGSVTE